MDKKIIKLTTLSILAAIGSILMLPFLEIPYPLAPMLMIEFSDAVVLLTYSIFGFKEAILVSIFKTLINLFLRGPVGPIAIGQITALLTSLNFCFGLYVANKFLKIKNKILESIIVIFVVTIFLTFYNYLFITPIYLGQISFLDFYNANLELFNFKGSYLKVIILIYVPFNIIKGSLVSIIYFLTYRRINNLIGSIILEENMENKYVIFCDLDNTLLTKDKKITRKSKKYIKKLIASGHKFIINTGRPLAGCNNYFKMLGENYPIITDNGSAIYLSKEQSVLFDVNKDLVLEIIKKAENFIKWGVIGTKTTTCFYNKKDLPFWLDHSDSLFLEKHGSFLETLKENPVHGTIAITKDFEQEFDLIISDERYKSIKFHKWNEQSSIVDYEFYNPSSCKGNAIKYLIDNKYINFNDTIAFGDGLNDITMLKGVNYGFSMINAQEEVKKSAKYITTDDYNHNGVIKEIKKFLKK